MYINRMHTFKKLFKIPQRRMPKRIPHQNLCLAFDLLALPCLEKRLLFADCHPIQQNVMTALFNTNHLR